MRLKGFLTMRRIFDIFDLDQEGDKAIMLSVSQGRPGDVVGV